MGTGDAYWPVWSNAAYFFPLYAAWYLVRPRRGDRVVILLGVAVCSSLHHLCQDEHEDCEDAHTQRVVDHVFATLAMLSMLMLLIPVQGQWTRDNPDLWIQVTVELCVAGVAGYTLERKTGDADEEVYLALLVWPAFGAAVLLHFLLVVCTGRGETTRAHLRKILTLMGQCGRYLGLWLVALAAMGAALGLWFAYPEDVYAHGAWHACTALSSGLFMLLTQQNKWGEWIGTNRLGLESVESQ